jgi:hypothetical protein
MSSSSNEEEPNQELDGMRDLIRQLQQQVSLSSKHNRELQQKVDELRMEQQIRSSLESPLSPPTQQEFDRMNNIIGHFRQKKMEMAASMTLNANLQMRYEELRRRNDALRSTFNTPFSTLPAQNLQPAIMSVAQLDGNWQTNLDNIIAYFETRKKRLLTQLQQTTPEPISAPTPFGATVSSGLPGTLQSQPNPILTVSGRALSNANGTPKDYDKPVEVEQCKLCESAWKLVFDVCATNAYRRKKIRILYQRNTLTTTYLFSLKLAVITLSIPKETPRTMESPQHTYLAGFYAYVSPSDNTAFQTTNQDISKTLIQALYDG